MFKSLACYHNKGEDELSIRASFIEIEKTHFLGMLYAMKLDHFHSKHRGTGAYFRVRGLGTSGKLLLGMVVKFRNKAFQNFYKYAFRLQENPLFWVSKCTSILCMISSEMGKLL